MTINEMLSLLSKKQNTWIKMAKSFGASQEISEDIVQEMYLNIFNYVKDPDKIMYNENEVNSCFIYITLRNLYTAYMGKKQKFIDIPDIEFYDDCEYSYDGERDAELDNLLVLIEKEIQTWSWYDIKIYGLYYKEGYTIKKLSDETGISCSSLYSTIKNCKNRLRLKFSKIYYS